MTQPILRVLIGPPGVGKTSWCASNDYLGTVLSLDGARAHFGAGEHDQTVTPHAVEMVRTAANVALRAGQSVAIDATGATKSDRGTWLEIARTVGAVPVATVFRAPLSICLARNSERDRQVPDDVIRLMWRDIDGVGEDSLRGEGFARVETVRTWVTQR